MHTPAVVMTWSVMALAIAGAVIEPHAFGETYFVSPAGNDANVGTSARPFRTIQKAAEVMLPGDVCTVRAGAYREMVRPARSGESGRPITFRARKKVVVTGAEPVSGWQACPGGVYKARVEGAVTQLFVDGRMMPEARWPNGPLEPMRVMRALAAAGTGPNTIVDPNLPDCDLIGAMVNVLPGAHWVSWSRPILGQDRASHSFQFNANWSQDWAHAVKEGSRYFLYGGASLLDAPGEWYWEAVTQTLSLMPPDGVDMAGCRVEVKRRDLAFDLSERSYIHLEGFRVFASAISLSGADHCVVDDCHVRYASHFTDCEGWGAKNNTGMVIGGHDNLVRDSSIVYSAGNGVTLLGENNTLTNCLVANVDYAALDCAAVWAEGTGNVISHNTLRDTGRSVIVHRTLRAGRIEYNDLYNAGLLTTDLGITYCFQTDGAGTVIAYNWAHDNKAESCGVGIYIDNGSSNFVIHHNVSWNNQDSGIRLNTPSHHNAVCHNTVLDNGNSLDYWGPDENKDQAGCLVKNNIFNNRVRTGDGIAVESNYVGPAPGVVSVAEQDFRLRRDSPCVNAGAVISGITGVVKGTAPDLGAYERGVKPWRAGHDWGEPPVF